MVHILTYAFNTTESPAVTSSTAPEVTERVAEVEADELVSTSPPDNEFASDAFQTDQYDEEALKKGIEQLGMSNSDPSSAAAATGQG